MALVRSLVHQRAHTWQKSFVDINSEWMVLQNRTCETDAAPPPSLSHKKVPGPRRRKRGRFKGGITSGGGKRRSSLGFFLRELWREREMSGAGRVQATREEKRAIMQLAHARAARAEILDQKTWMSRGKAGTRTHRCGLSSFGRHRPSRDKPSPSMPPDIAADHVGGDAGGAHPHLSLVRSEMEETNRQRVLRTQRQCQKRRRVELAGDNEAVRQWTANRSVDLASVIPELRTGVPWPVGIHGKVVNVVQLAPPSIELAGKALSGFTDRALDDADIKKFAKEELLASWRARCEGFMAAQCRPIDSKPRRPTICALAQRCLCGTPDGRNTMRFVRGLTACLLAAGTGLLIKGKPARKLYDEGRAVVRVFKKEKRHVLRPKDVWAHLSFGNLVSTLFHVAVLVESTETIYGEGFTDITLQWDGRRPATWWIAFLTVDITKNYDLEIWELADAPTLVGPFVPGVWSLHRSADAPWGKVWRANAPARLPLPGAGPGPGGGPGPAPPIEDWRLDGPTEPVPNPVAEKLSRARQAVRCLQAAAGRGRGAGQGRGAGRGRSVVTDWDVILTESSSDSGGEGGGGGGDGPAGGGGGHGPPPPIVADPPPPVGGPPDDPHDSGEEGNSARTDKQGRVWLKVVVDGAKYILNPYTLSVGFHCPRHGPPAR
jgi:hypothetical protein